MIRKSIIATIALATLLGCADERERMSDPDPTPKREVPSQVLEREEEPELVDNPGYNPCAEEYCAISGTLRPDRWGREREMTHTIQGREYEIRLAGLLRFNDEQPMAILTITPYNQKEEGPQQPRYQYHLSAGECADLGHEIQLLVSDVRFERAEEGSDRIFDSEKSGIDYCLIPGIEN
tara:strand:- start:413 stop:949 length:537 start_codon:yes stop_codon:yes gene_type:complete